MKDVEILMVGKSEPVAAAGDSLRVARVSHVPDLGGLTGRLRGSAREVLVEGASLLPEISRVEQALGTAVARAQDLERRGRDREVLVAQILHDIRGGLTVVRGYAGILKKGAADCRKTQSCVEQIIRSTGDLSGLLEELLLMSQCEAGRLQLHLTETRVREEIISLLEAHRLQAQAKGLSLESRFLGGVPEVVQTDVLRLRRMIGNLVANAVKFTESGQVTVEVAHGGGQLRVTVADTGPGIPPEYHEAIFEPYHQGGTEVFVRFGGSGLGLSAVRKVARLMGGDVSLVKSAPGEGSVFCLTVKAEAADKLVEEKKEQAGEKSL